MKFLNKLLSSIPLLIIGGLLLKIHWPSDDICGGMPEGILSIFLFFLYFITLVIIVSVNASKAFKKGIKMNYTPFATTGVLIIIGVIISAINSPSESANLLSATNGHYHHSRLSLYLKKNGRFEATESLIEYGCLHKGKYVLHEDTVILLRDMVAISDSSFSDKYLIDITKRKLYPLGNVQIVKDTNRWLSIVPN